MIEIAVLKALLEIWEDEMGLEDNFYHIQAIINHRYKGMLAFCEQEYRMWKKTKEKNNGKKK